MVYFEVKGSFKKTQSFFDFARKFDPVSVLSKYGKQGVEALRIATPKGTGTTAESWYYTISETSNGYVLEWNNSNVIDEWCNVAVILDTGHGTNNGGYVRGLNYIEPAIQPVFEKILKEAWEEVVSYGIR